MAINAGILSGVSLVPETIWGKVPLTTNQVGIASTNPARFFTIEADGEIGTNPDILVPRDEVDGDFELKRTIKQAVDFGGGYGFKVDGENIVYPLLGVMGRATQGVGGTGSTAGATKKQIYYPYNKSLSFTSEAFYQGSEEGMLASGVIIGSLDFTFSRTMMARFAAYAMHKIPNEYPDMAGLNPTQYDFTSTLANIPPQMNGGTSGTQAKITTTPGYVDVYPTGNGNGPFTFANMVLGAETGFNTGTPATSGIMMVNDVLQPYDPSTGAGTKIMEGMSLNISRNIQTHHVALSGYDIGACNSVDLAVGGNIQILFEDNSIPKALTSKSKISLNFAFVGIAIGATAVPYKIEFHIPRARFLSAPVSFNAGAIVTGGGWVAEKDATLGYSIKVTVTNSFDISTLAGQEGTSPSGLGGFRLAFP